VCIKKIERTAAAAAAATEREIKWNTYGDKKNVYLYIHITRRRVIFSVSADIQTNRRTGGK